MAELPRAYWDACAWLGLLNGEPEKIQSLEHIYELARRGQYEVWTSTIAYVEVFRLNAESKDVKPLKNENLDKIRNVIEQYFVKLIPLDMEIGRHARQLRRELPEFQGAGDAIHLASAIVWNIETLHTWDNSHLLPWNGKVKCKNGSFIKIEIPKYPPPAGPLFQDD
jgi:predicted nucleic acid-binding protein